ncbi:hypothetical protein [Streptomyces thermodiastaticus]|jgi:hypothetical protein|uniref:hypothetical protein n=1 Tax=Streptomyces thermodiastaticus TaxID=44061 RepID=UPI0016796C5B|nr:hypothetical protein [Streptomyces thermodiastaticus]MCE7550885.1 hypothetical protein [Streptomyces thermodiastaticus]GHF74077.1 hypothetical protein GCM10018787_23470 [Streptomyces thermodiastaticus]
MTHLCGLCEQQLEHGHLCPGCTRATTQRLERMPTLWNVLAAFLAPGSSGSPLAGRTRPAEAPLPVRENVLTLRAAGGIAGILEDWRAAMQADRGWGPPAVPVDVGRRVTVAARALAINMDWIASDWPLAGQMAHEIRGLERDVLTIVDPEDPDERRHRYGTRIGYCVAALPDGEVCGAVLRAYPGEATLTCRWCATAYQPKDYLMLRQLQPAAPATHLAPNPGVG